MTRIASRHSGRRTSPASRRSRLKSDIEMHYCISRFTMQEEILQLRSTIKPGGATGTLPATPSRNRRKRQNQSIRKNSTIPQSNFYSSWGVTPEVPNHVKWEGQHPRCPQPPKSSYLKNSTITSVNFHSSKGPSPEVPFSIPAQLYNYTKQKTLLPHPYWRSRSLQLKMRLRFGRNLN